MITIPTSSDAPAFSQLVQIEGRSYRISFYWLDLTASWYASIATEDKTPIAQGRRLSAGFDLFGQFTDPRLPPGRFVVVDNGGTNQDPGREDLGSRVVVIYAAESEVEAIDATVQVEKDLAKGIHVVGVSDPV